MVAADPLVRQIQAVQFTDSEIKRLVANAQAEAKVVMSRLEAKGTTAAAVRQAQVAMASVTAGMWASVGQATAIGIGDGVWQATEFQALFDEALFASVGIPSTYWRQSMIAQAKQHAENLISRGANNIPLSTNVYRNAALSKGYVDRTINNGLLLGKSPAEIAKDVTKYIDPNTPGGVKFAAQRLGRTEVLNAYHTTTIRQYKETPWVERVRWWLSGSHPRPDECNEFAENTIKPNDPPGTWTVGTVPAKPHPNCLCYTTPEMVSLDQYAKNYHAGKYDNYINKQMGCYRV